MDIKKHDKICELIRLYLKHKNFDDYYEENADYSTKFSITKSCEDAEIEVFCTGLIKVQGEMDSLHDELVKLKKNIEDGTCFAYWFLSCDDLLEKFPGRADDTVSFLKEAIVCYLNENNLAAFYMLGVAAEKAQDEYQKTDDSFISRIVDLLALSANHEQPLEMSEDERIALELYKYYRITRSEGKICKIVYELEPDEISSFVENITKLYEIMS